MFTMLKKNTKYIPSRIPEKESNNINNNNNDDSDSNDANIYKTIENKLGKFAKDDVDPILNADYYYDTYKIEKISSNRKAFIVKYMFTYEEDVETDDISRGYRTVYQSAIEDDNWTANSVEHAILLTYRHFGKSYPFRKKYGDKKNLKLLGIYDVYVNLHHSYISNRYSDRESTWNTKFREEFNSGNNEDNFENKE